MHAQQVSLRALLAVARLTIFAGAAGCAGNVIVETDETGSDIDPGDPDPDEPPDVVVDVDPAETACFEGAADTAACCNAVLTEAFASADLLADPSIASEEQKACCELAVTTMDTWAGPDEPPFHYDHPTTCCSTGLVDGGWEAHPSCTPWGPPMPPAMPIGFSFGAFEVLA